MNFIRQASVTWLSLRKLLEKRISRQRLDRILNLIGFFRLKAISFQHSVRFDDGTILFFRSGDRHIIKEVWEQRVYAAASLDKTGVVIDVGAHIGSFSCYAARRSKAVFAVEPVPWNIRLLKKNIRANTLKNVMVLPLGVSDRSGSAVLSYPGDDAMWTMYPRSEFGVKLLIKLMTLDDLAQKHGITSCELLKIDSEGAELDALKGASQLLLATHQVIMEASKETGVLGESRELLEAKGFFCKIVLDGPGSVVLYAVAKRYLSGKISRILFDT